MIFMMKNNRFQLYLQFYDVNLTSKTQMYYANS
jgi:hypothetical protein